MLNKIVSVKPMENMNLLVQFQNGKEKSYNVKMLYDIFPQMKELENNDELFYSAKADPGGYGISWNDDLDIDAEEIWENGEDTGKQYDVDISSEIGLEIIKAREIVGLTQKELSKRTGIDQADISKIERGKANPSLSTLKKIANGLDMCLQIDFIPMKNDSI